MSQVTISVGGRQYRLSCDEGEEEHLSSLGEKLDAMIGELREAFGEIGDQRLTVMAAILALDRLGEAESRIGELESGNSASHSGGASAAELEKRYSEALEKAAMRIEGLAQSIGEAVARSEPTAATSDPA